MLPLCWDVVQCDVVRCGAVRCDAVCCAVRWSAVGIAHSAGKGEGKWKKGSEEKLKEKGSASNRGKGDDC